MLKKISILFILIIFSSQFAACKSSKLTRYQAQFLLLFDTLTNIIAYSESEEEFNALSNLVYDKLEEYHEAYDIYNDYDGINNIKTINDNAGISPVLVDKKVIDLLIFAKSAYEKTDGQINIAFGAVLSIWHTYRTEGIDDAANASVPSLKMLEEASLHTDINKVIIDEENSTVFLEDPDMSLDVGAIAKGYTVERVAEALIQSGYNSCLLDVGGNVRAVGYKNAVDKTLWNVGITNPDSESEASMLHILYINDKSIVTSGNYQRYYTVDGKRYHHIIDPETLMPTEYFAAVTIICKDSGMADALSTSIFNMPLEQGRQFIEGLSQTEAMWVTNSGETYYSENYEDYMKN